MADGFFFPIVVAGGLYLLFRFVLMPSLWGEDHEGTALEQEFQQRLGRGEVAYQNLQALRESDASPNRTQKVTAAEKNWDEAREAIEDQIREVDRSVKAWGHYYLGLVGIVYVGLLGITAVQTIFVPVTALPALGIGVLLGVGLALILAYRLTRPRAGRLARRGIYAAQWTWMVGLLVLKGSSRLAALAAVGGVGIGTGLALVTVLAFFVRKWGRESAEGGGNGRW